MTFLFGEYELLMRSALFDAEYYRAHCPEVAQLNMDPLTHYLEHGSRERLNPSAGFDTSYYLEQCRRIGETPANALLHYLTVGLKRGLAPAPEQESQLHVDVPRITNQVAVEPIHGGLSIAGWAHSPRGVETVEIGIDGSKAISARLGLYRPDVVAAFPGLRDASHSGFAAQIPAAALEPGLHYVTISTRDRAGGTRSTEFQIDVRDRTEQPGPWQLCTRVNLAYSRRAFARLAQMDWQPLFHIIVSPAPDGAKTALQLTLASLENQVYRHWQRLPKGEPDLILSLAAGDELGADALLEWALASGADRQADLFYSDERRLCPLERRVGAFFKPPWSPDLLLATNYIGRAWCARPQLLARAGVKPEGLAAASPFDTILRLSEAASAIRHIPKVLSESSLVEPPTTERAALRAALKRRGIAGSVRAGRLPGQYSLLRQPAAGRVSIIIPTAEPGQELEACIESLRAHTRHKDFEILVVAGGASMAGGRRKRLGQQADTVVVLQEPFAWARFCNRAAAKARGDYLMFMDETVRFSEPGWLEALLQPLQRGGVGMVGPVRDADEAGHFGLGWTSRNVATVPGDCLMVAGTTFAAMSGFPEDLAAATSVAAACRRLREQGLTHVVTPLARLERTVASEPSPEADDPYRNPNLQSDALLAAIEREPVEVLQGSAQLFAPESIRRILVVKLDHIGDCITALPAVRRLKEHFPHAALTVLCASGTVPIWRAEPAVSDTLEFNLFAPRSGLGKLTVSAEQSKQLEQKLCSRGFDLAVDLRKQPDSRHVLADSGARFRAGFDHQGRFPWLDVALEWDEDVPLRTKHGHVTQDLIALVDRIAQAGRAPPEAPPSMPPAPNLPRVLARRLAAKPYICVHPAAGTEMRQWPVERFVSLIEQLQRSGQYSVALVGGPDDGKLIRDILEQSAHPRDIINLAGPMGLADLPGLLARCVLFVGNNSGPQHLAASLGVPTVGIHSGVVDATEWGPQGPQAVTVRRRMTCSPCFLEKATDCQRGLACLTGLSVGHVHRTCLDLLPFSQEAVLP